MSDHNGDGTYVSTALLRVDVLRSAKLMGENFPSSSPIARQLLSLTPSSQVSPRESGGQANGLMDVLVQPDVECVE
jgi:hypothetical protein